MPVRKFRSLQEMEDSLWRGSGVPLWEAIARVWRFAERVTAYRFPPGIYKHRSIEQAQQLREYLFTADAGVGAGQKRPPRLSYSACSGPGGSRFANWANGLNGLRASWVD